MKAEINRLLTDGGSLRLNQFCVLNRYTVDCLGNSGDWLNVSFAISCSEDASFHVAARDWRGIVAEVQQRQSEVFAAVADKLNSRLGNGRID